MKLKGVAFYGKKRIMEEAKTAPRTIYRDMTFIKSSN